ncbi:MAG: aspartate-semialdehyde dehydrogenase [Actinobacteria bacterium]|nr:aspartate-semialdehyde dehydrogenase [Actinomycetota bacterium]
MVETSPRIAVVGASGAVGRVTLQLLLQRGYSNIRTFASWRSAGQMLGNFELEAASVAALGSGDFDVCFFSVGAATSATLVPAASAAGALCIDKSSAFRLRDDVPLVVPEVNGERALENTGIVANPNCCAIPLSMVLAPLHEAAGLRRVRVATYQSVSGAGAEAIEDLRGQSPDQHKLSMDWAFDGVEFDEEVKLREETRKILELPDLPISATCVRVPVVVGHAQAVWLETIAPLSPKAAERALREAPGLHLEQVPMPARAIGVDEVLVGRVRAERGVENGLVLFTICDNLLKGAALNAVQIAELVIGAQSPAYIGHRS